MVASGALDQESSELNAATAAKSKSWARRVRTLRAMALHVESSQCMGQRHP